MKLFRIYFLDGRTKLINRNRIENVRNFLIVTGMEETVTEIREIDIYQELRMIGLTHDQCDQVTDLFEAFTSPAA